MRRREFLKLSCLSIAIPFIYKFLPTTDGVKKKILSKTGNFFLGKNRMFIGSNEGFIKWDGESLIIKGVILDESKKSTKN